MPMVDWNTTAMFEFAGGTQAVLAICKATGTPAGDHLKIATVNVWRHRGRISGEWTAVVVSGLLAKGMPIKDMFRPALRNYDARQGDLFSSEPTAGELGL